MKKLVQKYPLLPLIVLSLAPSFFYIFSQIRTYPLNSDMLQAIVEAGDILRGNILLSNYYLSSDSFYFTDVIPFSLFLAVFGRHSFQGFYLFSAISYYLIIAVSVFISIKSFRISTGNVAALSVGNPPVFNGVFE